MRTDKKSLFGSISLKGILIFLAGWLLTAISLPTFWENPSWWKSLTLPLYGAVNLRGILVSIYLIVALILVSAGVQVIRKNALKRSKVLKNNFPDLNGGQIFEFLGTVDGGLEKLDRVKFLIALINAAHSGEIGIWGCKLNSVISQQLYEYDLIDTRLAFVGKMLVLKEVQGWGHGYIEPEIKYHSIKFSKKQIRDWIASIVKAHSG